ncbi:MAG: tRNA uridine-5-carboxymethylaminomethyl(34) synthesis GTPase MnmE [Bacteroidales bacterium]|nr:tRNA uridine-5-carboxymethylaminomethyl(34) synthesis GTPase MnmE [Bacteroidales bacterium]MCF8456592.1 tRNA uridine-5-carboxymethylaminomethyl(34) synthesis GTPase MnmE [Bacteroidales bacterium]
MNNVTTICAIASAPGNGAIAFIRLSGNEAFSICESIFEPATSGKKISKQKAFTIHFGKINDEEIFIDEVLVSLFRNPQSYTGEDLVEISCHGSQYIQQQILQLLIKKGAVLAQPGEFTLRAFLNGKMDLSQAEGVADLIASSSEASHKIAMQQMRGSFSIEINELRKQLLNFISLIELELDFSEEDVEFADRTDLSNLMNKIHRKIVELTDSFELGNVIKEGIPVAIVGNPNVGKSTLLNILLKEDRAIVSEIPGTTRDAIEDIINIKGITFRFIDTAGLRETHDKIEIMGIDRTKEKIRKAAIVLLVLDASDAMANIQASIRTVKPEAKGKQLIIVVNKVDLPGNHQKLIGYLEGIDKEHDDLIYISARTHINIDKLNEALLRKVDLSYLAQNNVVVSNIRHFEALEKSREAIERAMNGISSGLTTDLLAMDIRQVLHYLGEITGEITNDEVLGNIFKNFCIGK